MKKYILVWTYGTHWATVRTNKKDFEKVINSLGTEFKIHTEKKEYPENPKFNNTTYYIYNYYGDKDIIGYEY